MKYLKHRLKSSSQELDKLLFSSFYRSLLVFYLVPPYIAGAINEVDVD